jgi:hypothetical protein
MSASSMSPDELPKRRDCVRRDLLLLFHNDPRERSHPFGGFAVIDQVLYLTALGQRATVGKGREQRFYASDICVKVTHGACKASLRLCGAPQQEHARPAEERAARVRFRYLGRVQSL